MAGGCAHLSGAPYRQGAGSRSKDEVTAIVSGGEGGSVPRLHSQTRADVRRLAEFAQRLDPKLVKHLLPSSGLWRGRGVFVQSGGPTCVGAGRPGLRGMTRPPMRATRFWHVQRNWAACQLQTECSGEANVGGGEPKFVGVNRAAELLSISRSTVHPAGCLNNPEPKIQANLFRSGYARPDPAGPAHPAAHDRKLGHR